MNFGGLLLFAVATFVAAPFVVTAAAARFIGARDKEQLLDLAAMTGITAPLVLSLVLSFLYTGTALLPEAARQTVAQPAAVAIVLLTIIIIAAYGRQQMTSVTRVMADAVRALRPPRSVLGWIALALVVFALVQAASLAVMENDALEYAAVAKYILREGSLASYPVVKADPQTGLFAPSSHPPAYHMLLVWGFATGGTESMAPLRITALYFILAITFLMVRILRLTPSPALGVSLLFATPLFVSMSVSYHIDAMRITAFTAACAMAVEFIRRPSWKEAVLAGYALGLALYAHSIGILAIPLTGIAFLVLADIPLSRKLQLGTLCCLVAIGLGGLQYFENLAHFGTPLQDSAPVFDMAEVDYASDMRARRDLITGFDRTMFGVLRVFSEPTSFGLTFWAGLLAAIGTVRHWRATDLTERTFLVVVTSYFMLNTVSAALGIDLMIKNSRYVMTLTPLVACLVAFAVARLMTSSRELSHASGR